MTEHITNTSFRIRWSWFPSLLFGDGLLPSVLILTLVMLRRYGLSNAQTALYISLLCLPFVLRPLFETVITYFRGTTKVWILSSEFIAALSLWATAFILPTGYWQQGTMCFLPFFVLSGVFYNIALERFYLERQSAETLKQNGLSLLFRCLSMLFGIGALTMLGGNMEVVTRNVRYSWSLVFYIMAGIEFFLWLWHSIFLPGGKQSWAKPKDLFGLHRHDYNAAIESLLQGWRNRALLYFFLLSLLPEALLACTTPLFIIDAPHNGGLGLSPQELGLTFGTISIFGLGAGCVLGNTLTRRFSISKCLMAMPFAMASHGMSVLYLSYHLGATLALTSTVMLAGSVALGISIAICHSVVLHFTSTGNGSTLRRAIALSLMSLTIIAINSMSGMILSDIGYRQFFMLASATYTITLTISCVLAYVLRIKHPK